jgi:sarcosine oxidase
MTAATASKSGTDFPPLLVACGRAVGGLDGQGGQGSRRAAQESANQGSMVRSRSNSISRRKMLGLSAAGLLGFGLARRKLLGQSPTGSPGNNYDIAVIGSGVFGAWTAYHLQQSGKKVIIIDAYGAANSRASSGGESRVIRMSYGADEIYTRWSMRALTSWKDFSETIGQPLFQKIGVLWMARANEPQAEKSVQTLQKLGAPFEKLSRAQLEQRFPQIAFGNNTWGIFEPESGALMARRAVQLLVQEVRKNGADFLLGAVRPPSTPSHGRLHSIETRSGGVVTAETFVFACGPWLPKIFPDLLKERIYPTRQEVFFFGPPPGDQRFAPPSLPVWSDFGEDIYGIPDLENRGFKIAPDWHGPPFDPETGERRVTPETLAIVRKYISRRFPALKDSPLIESRVCQYENTSNGDFLIDRHPGWDNVWLIGGGSGHGFKHGPALGEYVAARIIDGGTIEARFTLATKAKVQKRTVL